MKKTREQIEFELDDELDKYYQGAKIKYGDFVDEDAFKLGVLVSRYIQMVYENQKN